MLERFFGGGKKNAEQAEIAEHLRKQEELKALEGRLANIKTWASGGEGVGLDREQSSNLEQRIAALRAELESTPKKTS